MRTHKGIPISNLYYMLVYVFEFVDESELIDAGADDFDNALDLLAFLLESGIVSQVKHGLHKEYVSKREELLTVRGKIDMLATARSRFARKQTISCEFDELSENNQMNQILKMTCLLLVKSDYVERGRRDAIKKTMLYFSEVEPIPLRSVDWAKIAFTRSNRSYRFLLSICQLIAEGMLVDDSKDGFVLAPYIDEDALNRLFERFVLRYYKVHHPELSPSSPKIAWALDEEYSGTMLPTMQTDIALSNAERFLIIDAKFYASSFLNQERYGTKKVHSGNLYQVFSYVKNKASSSPELEVLGMLLYARTREAIQPNERFLMDGNEIFVRTLDLAGQFDDISSQLEDIAALMKPKQGDCPCKTK